MPIRDPVTMGDAEDLRWWLLEGRDRADSIGVAFRRLEENDTERTEDYKRFTRIYENRDYLGLSPGSHSARRAEGRSVFNITQMAGDTIAARIGRARPHGRAQTFAGNHSLQKKARMQERWVESEQYRSGLEREAPEVLMDAIKYGTGVFKHFAEGRRIVSERVFPGELFVDAVEGYEGKPRQYFQRKWVPRHVLMAKYSDYAAELEHVQASSPGESFGREPLSDQLPVVECWLVGDDVTGAGGHYSCAVGCVLLGAKAYKHPSPPFTFMRWTKPSRGFWGIGLVEELLPLHLDINMTMSQIQQNLKYGNFQAWMDAAGRVQGKKLTNEIGAINYYRGERPAFLTLDPVSMNLVTHLNQQIERAYAKAGVSADSVAAQNTLGADASGKARRMFHEVETQRYAMVEQQWQWLWMDNYNQYLRLGKELSQRFKDYTVVASNDRYTVEQLKWDDFDMDAEQYVIRVAPISALPTLPSDRLAFVQELWNMQLIDPSTARRLLDWPDIDEELALDRAASDNISRIVERILDEGEYEGPEPTQDLTLATKRVQAWVERTATMEDVPEDRRQMLRDYLVAARMLQARAEMAAAGMQGAQAPGTAPQFGSAGQAPGAVLPTDGTLQ